MSVENEGTSEVTGTSTGSESTAADSGAQSGGSSAETPPAPKPTGLERVAAAKAAKETVTDPGDGTQGVVPPVVPPSYVPNLKYKVMREEKEFPAWAKEFLKDPETEKNVRELFEKAGGLDDVKQHRDRIENENKQIKEQWGPVINDVQKASQYVRQKDLDSFFELVGIPEADVLRYALHRIQLRENPEALQTHEQMRSLQLRNQELEAQYNQTNQSYQETAVQARERELAFEMARPEILANVQAFEARMGTPGAFRSEVIRRGQAYMAAGQDISVEQAVREVLHLAGLSTTPASTQVAPPAAPPVVEPTITPAAPKATLPNIRGKGTSPTKLVPKSTDELRKLAATFRG